MSEKGWDRPYYKHNHGEKEIILVEAQERVGCTGYGEMYNRSTSETACSLGRGETAQKAAHSRQHHRIHDLLAQHGKGGFNRSIDDLYHVALPRDGDIADTRMPCQGPAHIQHSQTAEKAVNLDRGTT
jgi:hypothetical protein